jgi:hypothetical protein
MTEYLAIAGVLKRLPRDLPPVAVTLIITAVEAKIQIAAYDAAITHRQNARLTPRPVSYLQDPRERAASVYATALAILNLEFAERAAPERPISSWKDLIDEAASVLDFQALFDNATRGTPESERV